MQAKAYYIKEKTAFNKQQKESKTASFVLCDQDAKQKQRQRIEEYKTRDIKLKPPGASLRQKAFVIDPKKGSENQFVLYVLYEKDFIYNDYSFSDCKDIAICNTFW